MKKLALGSNRSERLSKFDLRQIRQMALNSSSEEACQFRFDIANLKGGVKDIFQVKIAFLQKSVLLTLTLDCAELKI